MKAFTARFLLPIEGSPLEDGVLLVEDDKIIGIGERQVLLSRYPKTVLEEFPDAVLMPGLVNAHTHLDLLFFEERATEFLEGVLAAWDYRRGLGLSERRQAVAEGIRQLARFGTTTVGDVGRYAGILPDIARSPIRTVLFPEIFTGGDATSPGGYESLFAEVEGIRAVSSPRMTVGLAPFAAHTLSRHLLKLLARQAQAMRLPIKIHAAETFGEIEFFYESKGEIAEKLFPRLGWGELPPEHRRTPIEYLEAIGFMEATPTLIGGNHLSDADLQILARRRVTVIHSPRANASGKLAPLPWERLRAAGIPVALGTDTTPSLSLWDEMRSFSGPGLPQAEDLLRMATLEGAGALGLKERIGSLEAGKQADLIAIRVPPAISLPELPGWLVSEVTDREIAAVFVAGNRLV